MQCSCQLVVYSKQEWCSNKNIVQDQIVSAKFVNWIVSSPVNFTLECSKCKAPPFLYFYMVSMPTFLQSRKRSKHVTATSHMCKKPLKYAIYDTMMINDRNYVKCLDILLHNIFNVANITVRISVGELIHFEINERFQVEIHECNNNTKTLTKYPMKPGDKISYFTQSRTFLISVPAFNKISLEIAVHICPFRNYTPDGTYWSPKTTER